MAEENDAYYRRRIIEILVNNGFGWVVQQADAQIAEGKQSSKQISEKEVFRVLDDPLFVVRTPRSRRASLITSEPYTERERLDILLQGIHSAIADRAKLEQAVFDQLDSFYEIQFEPDVPSEEAELGFRGNPHKLARSRLHEGSELAEDLIQVLARVESDRDST